MIIAQIIGFDRPRPKAIAFAPLAGLGHVPQAGRRRLRPGPTAPCLSRRHALLEGPLDRRPARMPRRGRFPGCGSPAHAFSRVTRQLLYYAPCWSFCTSVPAVTVARSRLAPTLLAHAHMRACAREGSDRFRRHLVPPRLSSARPSRPRLCLFRAGYLTPAAMSARLLGEGALQAGDATSLPDIDAWQGPKFRPSIAPLFTLAPSSHLPLNSAQGPLASSSMP